MGLVARVNGVIRLNLQNIFFLMILFEVNPPESAQSGHPRFQLFLLHLFDTGLISEPGPRRNMSRKNPLM